MDASIKVNEAVKEAIDIIEEDDKRMRSQSNDNSGYNQSKFLINIGINYTDVPIGRKRFDMENHDRQERDKIKREMVLGADYLSRDDEFRIFIVKKRSCCECLKDFFLSAINCFIPLSSDVEHIKVFYY